jgi:ribosome-binding factor A
METQRQDKVANLLRELASTFIQGESNKTSLITITACTVSKDLKKATLFFTVLPDDKERVALEFLKRKRSEFRDYLKGKLETHTIPFVDFEIDKGEKNRQLIDQLLLNN